MLDDALVAHNLFFVIGRKSWMMIEEDLFIKHILVLFHRNLGLMCFKLKLNFPNGFWRLYKFGFAL